LIVADIVRIGIFKVNLKKNPSLALRQAEQAPVLVLKGDEPNTLIIHLDKSGMDGEHVLQWGQRFSL